METGDSTWESIEKLLTEITQQQQQQLLKTGQRIVPTLTADDMLQPNDFQVLDNNPLFRYEEGVLAGIQTVQMALRAMQRDRCNET